MEYLHFHPTAITAQSDTRPVYMFPISKLNVIRFSIKSLNKLLVTKNKTT